MMKNKKLILFWISVLLFVLLLGAYPIYMGIDAIIRVTRDGGIYFTEYRKYIIPYTPISLAVIVGTALLPLMLKLPKKAVQSVGTGIAAIVFFVTEWLLEHSIIVITDMTEITGVPLEGWQLSLCYVSPDMFETRTWKAYDILGSEYSQAFKIHFYLIALVLIVTILSCVYGFGKMIAFGEKEKKKLLITQAVLTTSFLGMCIWACFTSFYRTGELDISPISSVLMTVFFILFGMTAGIFVGTLLYGRKKAVSIVIPAVCAGAVTLAMYLGELLMLNGHLYRFGLFFLFAPIPGIVLSAFDILTVLISGVLTYVLMNVFGRQEAKNREKV